MFCFAFGLNLWLDQILRILSITKPWHLTQWLQTIAASIAGKIKPVTIFEFSNRTCFLKYDHILEYSKSF